MEIVMCPLTLPFIKADLYHLFVFPCLTYLRACPESRVKPREQTMVWMHPSSSPVVGEPSLTPPRGPSTPATLSSMQNHSEEKPRDMLQGLTEAGSGSVSFNLMVSVAGG